LNQRGSSCDTNPNNPQKKANQQKVHHAFALFEFDPNWLNADLDIHDVTIFASLAFQVFFKMGVTIVLAMCL